MDAGWSATIAFVLHDVDWTQFLIVHVRYTNESSIIRASSSVNDHLRVSARRSSATLTLLAVSAWPLEYVFANLVVEESGCELGFSSSLQGLYRMF